MKLPRIAINNAQFTFIIAILLVLVGIVSYFHMPRSEDPQFDLPITLIEVVYPGASPSDIESLVVNPIEQEVSTIENILKVESQIKNGGTRITIEFIYGVDPEEAFNKVKQAVSSIQSSLPDGIQQLSVFKATPISVAIMQIALWSEPHDYKSMEFHSKQLEKRLEALSGVKEAEIWGYPQQIVAVDVNLDLLKHYKLSITDISNTLKGRALNVTPGFVDAGNRRFNVTSSGSFEHVNEISETVIRSDQQAILRLKDVAHVHLTDREPTYLAYYQHKPVIFITVQQSKGTNIFELTKSIEAEISRFQQSLPSEIKLETLFKQADSVEVRVDGFFDNLWQGLIIVGLMSLLFLGFREAAVVVAAIPLSFLIAIGWLDFAGFGLQQMSIVGLIIALGLLVDNAIVVTESIHREKAKDESLVLASAKGTSKVGWAITSGTVTTMFAFLPMLLMASNTGDFLRSMPVTVVLVLLASLLIALTVTPLLASKLFKKKDGKIKALQHYLNIFAEGIYARFLAVIIRFKILLIIIFIIGLVGMVSLFPQVGVSLFPKAEKPMLLIDVEAPVNSSLNYTEQVMQEIAQDLSTKALVKNIALNIGNANPRIYYNEMPKRGVPQYGQILVLLTEYESNKVNELVNQLRAQYKNWSKADVSIKEFTQGPVTDQPVTFRLMSESLADLHKVAADLTEKMKSTAGIININNPIGMPNTEVNVAIDYEKAGLYSIDINKLDNTIKTTLSGENVGFYNDLNGESYPVVLRRNQFDIESLNDIYIENNHGKSIPLSQVTEIKLQQGQTDFFHYQKLRMAKVSADVEQGYSINELTLNLVEYLSEYKLPQGMYFMLGGEEESRQASFSGLFQILMITAVGIFAVLVLQFKSILQPLIIFTSIPFAMAGSVIGLYLTGLSFSIMAFIGLISLFGIVVNNAIILIDTANTNLKQTQEKQQAIVNAASTRFTPILLTTLTTIGGLLPLTLYGGAMWQSLGVVIISGLCVSAIASFLLVPVLTLVFTKNKKVINTTGTKLDVK
ncbi:efflux RND transporter permease subunit [Thalassotalea profundi]|uniref:Multidrug transporter AcrB n=1 Tax=Thalassotalea profundi TaxID=2036687 RepID=A0ABQ3INK6_9GAMM|nr:efflux RND transporter permease subunit [Thalassotalea profundi]GHE88887.1 multidrug transporter AcrB [Thalassotalea profundi]